MVKITKDHNDQEAIADWFSNKADPDHASMVINGFKWEYRAGKWVYKAVNDSAKAEEKRVSKENKEVGNNKEDGA